ncbi:MAG: extracellular solute-binding protein family 1 [Paenibacillus sp.]|jgi:multiple sugar transport system substrate-binding protein|nr:extracellular solute-binding protein family 1 [Paenibacillus sp.]
MKKGLLYLTASIGMAGLVAGCSSGSTSSTGSTDVKAPAETAPAGPVEINLVTPDATVTKQFMEELSKKFPNYTIKHIDQSAKGSTVEDLLTIGTQIDIIGRAGTGFENDVIKTKLEFDMTALIKENKINLADYEPQLISYIKSISNGGMYGIPGGSAINHVLFMNKSIFDQFGVPYLKDGMMWTEVMDIAAKLTRSDGGKQYYGFTGHTGVMTSTNQLGIPLVDKATNKPAINKDERWRSYFQIVYGNQVLNDAYRQNNRAFSGSTSRLVDGSTAILLFNAGISLVTKELQEEKINWDMVALPSFKEAPNTGSPMNSTIWGLTKQTRNKKAAMEVLRFLVSSENLTHVSKKGYLTPMITDEVVKNFAVEAKPANKNWKAIVYNKYAAFGDKHPGDSEIAAIHTKYIEQIVKGTTDMNTAMRQGEEEALKVVEKYAKQ